MQHLPNLHVLCLQCISILTSHMSYSLNGPVRPVATILDGIALEAGPGWGERAVKAFSRGLILQTAFGSAVDI